MRVPHYLKIIIVIICGYDVLLRYLLRTLVNYKFIAVPLLKYMTYHVK